MKRPSHSRRAFLRTVAAGSLSLGVARASASLTRWPTADHLRPKQSDRRTPSAALKKAVLISMLPERGSYAERFAIGRDAGFEAIEMRTIARQEEAAEVLDASKRTGLRVHSVMNADHWQFPLSSGDRAVVDKSVAGMETSLRNAALWGADAVLLVPAVVDPATTYQQAWERSQRVIRERLLPLARELKIVIAVEEVWNKFLLSPLEFARYVDELDSPWVKAYFDVGNVVFYGYPQDWIRTLGARIVKLHLKDFQLDRPNGRFAWKNLGEGDIDWPAVKSALGEIGYQGYATTEVAGGDAEYLKDVAARVDRLLGTAGRS